MIDFYQLPNLESEPGPRCPFCDAADTEVDEHFPDTVVFRCPKCFMRAAPHQIQAPTSNVQNVTLMPGALVLFFTFLAIVVLGIMLFLS